MKVPAAADYVIYAQLRAWNGRLVAQQPRFESMLDVATTFRGAQALFTTPALSWADSGESQKGGVILP